MNESYLQTPYEAWCSPEINDKLRDELLAKAFDSILDDWIKKIKQSPENCDFYRGLFNEYIQKYIEMRSNTAYNETIYDESIRLKISEIVKIK